MSGYDEWKTRGHDAGFCKFGGCDRCAICHEAHAETAAKYKKRAITVFPKCDFCKEEEGGATS